MNIDDAARMREMELEYAWDAHFQGLLEELGESWVKHDEADRHGDSLDRKDAREQRWLRLGAVLVYLRKHPMVAEVRRLRDELFDATSEVQGVAVYRVGAKLARVEALLARIVKYAHEDRAMTPGTTRLARALEEAEAALKDPP